MSKKREAASAMSADELASLSREGLMALVLEQFAHIDELRQKLAALTHEVERLRRWRFGKRSEKLTAEVASATTGQATTGAEAPAAPPPRKPRRRARPHGRNRLPEHLPRKPVHHEVPEADRICKGCHKAMTQIGEEVSEQLHIVPATVCVLKHIRPKFACPRCKDHVVTAAMPPQAVDRCLASPALLAHVVTNKFADHVPLNRFAGILKRQGVDLTRSTLSGWVGATAAALEPLYEFLKADVLASHYIQADDTTVPYLVLLRHSTKTGHLWVYRGDRRHSHVVFEFSPDWKGTWPLRFLETFKGYLQADAYKGWDAVYKRTPLVVEVGCMAHARRPWFEAKDTSPVQALQALSFIRRLYDVEDEVRGMPDDGRKHLRQLKAAPVLAEFREWMDQLAGTLLPKSPIGQAWTYTHNQWTALGRYIEDGELEIDNNAAERSLRPVALGRANWTFAGNEEGGRWAAIFYSFVESCKRNRIDPLTYFTDVLERLPTHPKDDFASLLPSSWKARSGKVGDELAAVAGGPAP